jgi:serine protease Do
VLVGNTAPGSKATLDIWRKGHERSLSVAVGDAGERTVAAKTDANPAGGRLGLALRPLTREEKSQVDGGQGLVVEDIADGPAARAGIEPGDVILSANGTPVASVEQLRKQLAGSDKRIALLIQRGDRRIFVPIKLG